VIAVASDLDPSRENQHVPGPSLWPVGLAVGVVVLLVGFVVSWTVVVIGGLVALVFAFLWIRDLARGSKLHEEGTEVKPEKRPPRAAAAAKRPSREVAHEERYPRNEFLEVTTLGLGAVIGALVTLPVIGFVVGDAFRRKHPPPQDLGPITAYPEGKFLITTFISNPGAGFVSRRTAFVRNNGFAEVEVDGKQTAQPSFTFISNHCAHLGCPVQPNGQVNLKLAKHYRQTVTWIPVNPSGFGCPCHGGQYDTEGNRTAGPPVRGLDRYTFSIVDGHLYVGQPFSVDRVEGTGADAKIYAATLHFPGEQVSGPESWLYPIQPPR
jgi:menaquinol-cytochrome c reductase iron-sulfur subunit